MGDSWKVEGRDAMKGIGVQEGRVKRQDPARRPGGLNVCVWAREQGGPSGGAGVPAGECVNGEEQTE